MEYLQSGESLHLVVMYFMMALLAPVSVYASLVGQIWSPEPSIVSDKDKHLNYFKVYNYVKCSPSLSSTP